MNRMLIFLLLLLSVSAPCHARIMQQDYEVQVLVLDYKTGRPVPEWEVTMMLPNIKGKYPPYSSTFSKETEKNGIVFFLIQSPIPQQVLIKTDWDGYSCTTQDVFDTSKVLQQGVIGDFELCKNIKSGTITAQPGEIVIYLRRPNRWQRIQRFFRDTFSGC